MIDTVATGILNLIPNKGGIGISFLLKNKRILVIGCHLSSGEKNRIDRNEDFNRIEEELELGKAPNSPLLSSDRFDCTILCGDLNYRIKGTTEMIRYLISEQER